MFTEPKSAGDMIFSLCLLVFPMSALFLVRPFGSMNSFAEPLGEIMGYAAKNENTSALPLSRNFEFATFHEFSTGIFITNDSQKDKIKKVGKASIKMLITEEDSE